MVGEEADMDELLLPPPLMDVDDDALLEAFLDAEGLVEEAPTKKRKPANRGAGQALEEALAENATLKARVRELERAERAADGAAAAKLTVVEHEKARDARKHRSDLKKNNTIKDAAIEQRDAEKQEKERLDAANQINKAEVRRLNGEMMEMRKRATKAEAKLVELAGQRDKQMEIVQRLREEAKTLVAPEDFAKLETNYQEQLDSMAALRSAVESLETEKEDAHEREAELSAQMKEIEANSKGESRSSAASNKWLDALKKATGIKVKSMSVPPRKRPPGDSEWEKLSVRHMAAVLEGRGEGDDINLIADALHRCGYLDKLMGADRMQAIVKGIVRKAVGKVQEHWTPRHSVHVWDRLELSRSQMQTLTHLLSFIYNPTTDVYVPIRAWTNPKDSLDFVLTARLAGRWTREREYAAIASQMGIQVGENGRCERDAIRCTSLLYTNYAGALRGTYTSERPAQPVLFLDGTGGGLGRGICHGEMGCADFTKVGEVDVKQSRATLQPLFLYEGNDHAEPLRSNLDLAITSYNKLVKQGCFDRVSSAGVTETLPARPLTAADMQGAKATYGMRTTCHSVWCKCKNREGGSAHHAFSAPKESYEEICEYCDEIGCEMKTFDEMCSWAHYSPGVARGEAFTPVHCNCCGYKADTEAKWRADLKAWHAMSDEEQAAAQAVHMDSGDPLNSHQQHHHQVLYMPPLPHHGMDRCGVDNLHLVYLNIFKHLFKYTVHEGLPESKKKLISKYLKDMHFYSYDAASLDDDPVSHWIGREVKRFIDEAHLHLPFLLQIAAAPADCVAAMAACANAEGEQQMEYDPDYAPTAAEVAAEEKLEPLMMVNATRWDRFLDYVHEISREWPQGEADTDEYRKGRALNAFNLGNAVAIDVHELKPTMLTWVPHIMCFIVPRQMVLLGDPTRRSCDACESFGAMAKKLIKHATCRRPLMRASERTDHGAKAKEAGAPERRWTQTFKVGFCEQAFKRLCVRESLQHGKANAAYLQRADARRTAVGKEYAHKKFVPTGSPIQPMPSVYEAAKALGVRPCA